ncbi:MAG: hypothetical protein E7446_05655 [Ruminococcaceae bacterium]|nr:hypothetical protein [Oscillospiraceae bacterium]
MDENRELVENTAGESAPDAGEETFETLIRGRYKADFEERVQKILDGRLRGLRRENERLRAQETARRQRSDAAFAALEGQQEALQQIYPEFDWQREVQKGEFARLIAAGIDARTAYEVTHREELLRRAMTYAAQRSAQQSARTVQSSRRRVSEAGTRSAAVTRSDPKALSSAQLADIRRRVMDGEKIRF